MMLVQQDGGCMYESEDGCMFVSSDGAAWMAEENGWWIAVKVVCQLAMSLPEAGKINF